MMKNVYALLVVMAAGLLITADAQAQLGKRMIRNRVRGAIAFGQAQAIPGVPTTDFVRPKVTARAAAQDAFSPHRVYAYSNAGLQATHTDAWNNVAQNIYPWHGQYKNSEFGTPTALVVPPSASYHSSYAWGVGQTRSTPIHHQFGRGAAANVGGSNGSHFQESPLYPSSTDQFGVYPVRAPW